MKRKHKTQRNHLVFRLKDYETKFIAWSKRRWQGTKETWDILADVMNFIHDKAKVRIEKVNSKLDGLKNPMVAQQYSEMLILNKIRVHNYMKRIKLTQRRKQQLVFKPCKISQFGQ